MTEATTPAPAEQALGSGQSALDADALDPTAFIPPATRDNYAQIARDQAAIRGVEPRAVMQEFAGTWQDMHDRNPLDGYDHLAQWARDFDPAAGGGPSGLAILQARALESARRDPYQAVTGDQALVEQGVAAQRAQDEQVVGVTAAPSVDPSSGMLPSAGPLPVPDVPTGTEGDQQQQQAAAEQQQQGEQPPPEQPAPAPAPEPTPEPTPEPAPEPTPESPAPSGKGSKSSS